MIKVLQQKYLLFLITSFICIILNLESIKLLNSYSAYINAVSLYN